MGMFYFLWAFHCVAFSKLTPVLWKSFIIILKSLEENDGKLAKVVVVDLRAAWLCRDLIQCHLLLHHCVSCV